MEYINPVLVLLGMCFILLGLLDYVKAIEKLKFFYKITKVSRRINVYIITLIAFFFFFYLFILFYILLGKIENNVFLVVTSLLLFLGGFFVYFVIYLLKKTFFSIESFNIKLIKGLVGVFELRDKYTKGHSEHVAFLVELIFKNLPNYLKNDISESDLIMAALLHDIGKILVPENILNKTGSLTDQEYNVIKKHVDDGSSILESFEIFKDIVPWVKYHHEKIDGNGYHGLKEDQIPLESKILAVADTYSALITNRVYRSKMSPKEAIEILKENSGTQLDSRIVEVLVEIVEKNPDSTLSRITDNF